MEIDKVIHEPARLRIMMILSGVEKADFNFIVTSLNLTRGNLSRHIEKLESAGVGEPLFHGFHESRADAAILKVRMNGDPI